MSHQNKTPTPWEIAKPILIQYYIDGTVDDEMNLSDVLKLREEFRAVKKQNFRNNFNNLKTKGVAHFKEEKERADWAASEAPRLLKIDVENKLHKKMTPELLWKSRPEYQEFDLTKFSDRIDQEKRRGRPSMYWQVKEKKRKHAMKCLRKGRVYNEDDINYCDSDSDSGSDSNSDSDSEDQLSVDSYQGQYRGASMYWQVKEKRRRHAMKCLRKGVLYDSEEINYCDSDSNSESDSDSEE